MRTPLVRGSWRTHTRAVRTAHARWPLQRRLIWLVIVVVAAVLALIVSGLGVLIPAVLLSDVDGRLRDATTTMVAR